LIWYAKVKGKRQTASKIGKRQNGNGNWTVFDLRPFILKLAVHFRSEKPKKGIICAN
jgi:hypothetical protein